MTKPTTLIPLSQARAGQRVRIHSLPQQPECRSRSDEWLGLWSKPSQADNDAIPAGSR